jgi:hypothetical protein
LFTLVIPRTRSGSFAVWPTQIGRTESGVLKRYHRKPKRLASKKIYMLQTARRRSSAGGIACCFTLARWSASSRPTRSRSGRFRVLGARRRDRSGRSFLEFDFIGRREPLPSDVAVDATNVAEREVAPALPAATCRQCNPLGTGDPSDRPRFIPVPTFSPYQHTTNFRLVA